MKRPFNKSPLSIEDLVALLASHAAPANAMAFSSGWKSLPIWQEVQA